jgi:hypothetical protein
VHRKKAENVVIVRTKTNGRTGGGSWSQYGSQVRHQSLYVFIISKLQFTIYIIKKNNKNNIYNNDVDS